MRNCTHWILSVLQGELLEQLGQLPDVLLRHLQGLVLGQLVVCPQAWQDPSQAVEALVQQIHPSSLASVCCQPPFFHHSLQVSPKDSASLQLICLHLRPHGADFANGAFEQLGRHVCCLRAQFRIYLGAAPMGKSRDCLACWLLWAPPLHHHPHTFLIITTSTFQLLSSGSQPF